MERRPSHGADVPPDPRRRSEPCRVIRPARPGEPSVEDDTDENHPAPPPISVSRTRTPADVTLEALLADLEGRGVPPEIALALEAIARRGAEDRKALETQLQAHVDAATVRTAQHTRWQRFARVVRGIGVGAIVAALGVVARVLVAHGDASAVARQQRETVERHGASIVHLQSEISTLRDQAAADHALISIFAARLSAVPISP